MLTHSIIPNLAMYRTRIAGEKEAVYDYDNQCRYTYNQLEDRANKLAAFLVEVIGLKKGDRIGFCSENVIAYIDAFFVSCKTGIIITSYNCMMGKAELSRLVKSENPKVFFYSQTCRELVDFLRKDADEREYISICGKAESKDNYLYEDIMEYQPKSVVDYETPALEDIQMLIHTGGTTGTPKAAMMSYRSILYNAISSIVTVELNSKDSAYVLLPFFHTAAWNVLTVPLLVAGGKIIITAKFNAQTALNIIKTERPTTCMGVETIYKKLASHPDFDKTDFSCYRWMLSGAAPIANDLLETYWNKGIKLVNAYGMTEIGTSNMVPPVNDMTIDDIRKKGTTVGKPLYFNNVRIVDEQGAAVEQGKRGELVFSGNLVFSGYWMDRENTQNIMTDGWVHTGDIGYKDEDGYYYICGRKKNMYISGGENIYPIEIEKILLKHPEVESACIIGVPDEKWGEVGKALIVKKENSFPIKESLQKFVLNNSSSIKVPKYVQFVDEIPKNAIGKLDLTSIREEFENSSDYSNCVNSIN